MGADHLSPKTREMLDKSLVERMAYIKKDSWIPYPAANDILQRLERIFEHPKCERMPNLAISAVTNNGKTRLIKHFTTLHPASDNPERDAINIPILYLQCPGAPDESRLYDTLLRSLFTKFRSSASPREKLPIVLEVLSSIQLRILAIDEVNYAEAGTMNKQKAFLNALRYIGNELQISLVLVGTEEMMRVIRTEPAMENRSIPVFLPRWNFNDDFRKMLASFEMLMPLRNSSALSSRTLATELYAKSNGVIGELKLLLADAAEQAMRDGSEKITLETIRASGYTPAGTRRRQPVPR